ncbi:hypothetical protein [Mycobacterium sp. IS-3022]|uniref:hypothetical protein n=1 Tax=Mycobacterium sp. IS-3022 TaxID=1772277 RepID=UPI000B0B5C3C|nr:hypothetical protein [Mycobacterium sp. IS-3022]
MCSKGHARNVLNGPCPECNRDKQAVHRRRNQQARKLAQALQDRHVPLDADRIAEGYRLVTVLDMARAVDREIR